ncbi:MEDS domain-containing protein [Kutzneria viridogrisea]|uniref:Anti-sigma regulatory factor (Ser/Thr protein kinase) n=1 Tax=Kutzneria viridogrisea TaxID=47990 RepID=A0ABR6BTM5_9PSEU|nr:anti-sigma regulatory factor (Ser/Thr protein kinase) [Kutzneria viridogrisea]
MSAPFRHQGCVYGSDAEFLAMAVPFVEEGLRRAEPVLVTTTAANLDLLHREMGSKAAGIDYAESAYFGRRPPQRATAFYRYWARKIAQDSTKSVRILAEPIWTGRSPRDVAAWKRMEAGLNVILADTSIWMICPYDTRIVPPDIIADSRRTHPECVVGTQSAVSPDFVVPELFAASCGPAIDVALPADPEEGHRFDGDLVALRRYVIDRAARFGLPEDRTAMFTIAAGEAITYLIKMGVREATAWIRPEAGQVVCTLHTTDPQQAHPFAGFRPPQLRERPGDGLWLTNQICERVTIQTSDEACTIEMAMPGPGAEELLQNNPVHPR